MLRSARPLRALIGALLAVVFVAGCRQMLVDPAPGGASLSVALDAGRLVAADLMSAFDKADRIYVRIERPGLPPHEVLQEIAPGGDEIRVSITLEIDESEEPATITIELRSGNEVLFTAVRQVLLVQGGDVSVEFEPTPVLSRLVISGPDVRNLNAIGATVQLEAVVQFATGDPLPGAEIEWSSSDPRVASVNAQGTVVAHTNGTATIRAVHGDLSDEVQVRVQQEVASVSVSPSAATIIEGESIQLTAVALDALGNAVSGLPVTWSAVGDAVTVNASTGLVIGRGPGTATVTATIGGLSDSATINVEPAPRDPFDGEWVGFMELWGYYLAEINLVVDQRGTTASGYIYIDYPEFSEDLSADLFGSPLLDAVIVGSTLQFRTYENSWGYYYQFRLELLDDGTLLGYAFDCILDYGCFTQSSAPVYLTPIGSDRAAAAALPPTTAQGRED